MASTEGQRAKWRIERAVKAKREVDLKDIQIMENEGLSLSEELQSQLQSLLANQSINQSQQEMQSPKVTPIRPQESPDQGSKDTGEARLPERKPKTKAEKDWYDFYIGRFGPLVVMLLYFAFRDLERARFYAPTPNEMAQAALPLAKYTSLVESYLKLPPWVHDVASSSDDAITLGMVLVSYLDRIGVLESIAPMYRGLRERMNNGQDQRPGVSNGTVPRGDAENNISVLNIPGLGSQWAPA